MIVFKLILNIKQLFQLQKLLLNGDKETDHGFFLFTKARILDLLIYFRIRLSFAHLRPVILSADSSISRMQSWTCASLPGVAEFVKLTQGIVIEIQRQSADLYRVHVTLQSTIVCGVHSDLRGKGIRVSPAWLNPINHFQKQRKMHIINQMK